MIFINALKEATLTASPFAVEDATHPIRDGIGVGRDVERVDHDVVGDIDDDGEIATANDALKAAQELPCTDAARERHDLH